MKRSNGEGSVYKSGKKYRGLLTIGYDSTGKQIRKSFTAKTKAEVLQMMNEYRYKYNIGSEYKDMVTLEKWFYNWLFEFRIHDLSKSTCERYESIYRNYIHGTSIGIKKLDAITSIEVQSYFNELIKSNKTTVTNCHFIKQLLNSSIEAAQKEGYTFKNPLLNVKLPKKEQPKKIEAITQGEQKKILDSLIYRQSEEVAIMVGLTAGLRLGEIRGLTWNNINLNDGELYIVQQYRNYYEIDQEGNRTYKADFVDLKTTSSYRTIPIPEYTIEKLKTWKKYQLENKIKNRKVYTDNDYVITDKLGQIMEKKRITRYLEKICSYLDIRIINFHVTRHTYATRLFEIGVQPKIVQALMGHSSLRTTMEIYVHVTKNIKKESIDLFNEALKEMF